jgi:hypothetical protein
VHVLRVSVIPTTGNFTIHMVGYYRQQRGEAGFRLTLAYQPLPPTR